MKKTIKKLLLLLPLLLLFLGCSKDVFEEPIKNETRFVAKMVSLKNVNDPKLNKAVQELKQNRDQFAGKIVYDSIYNFYYDDENGIYLEGDDKRSYTFLILKDSTDIDQKIEKLVFQYKTSGDVKTYRVKYDFTKEELENLTKEDLEQEPIVITDISTNKCDVVVTTYQITYTYTPFESEVVNIDDNQGWNVGVNESSNHTVSNPSTVLTYTINESSLECGGNSEISSSPYIFGGGTLSPYGDYSSMQIRFLRDLGLYGQTSFTHLGVNTQNAVFDYIHSYNYTGYLYTRAVNVIKALMSNPQHSDFLISQSQFTQSQIFNYLIQNAFNLGSQTFITQCITQMAANPNVFTNITPFLIEKYIDDSQLDPCSKGVLDAIKNSQNNDVATIIAKLGDTNNIYNTKIVTASNLGLNLGQTNWTGFINGGTNHTPNNYTIQINNSLINDGTTLQIYATMLHELIHAYFISLIDECILSNGTNCTTLNTLPYLWQEYVNFSNGNIGNPITDLSQHNQLATNYITVIATALQEYQPGLPQQYYEDLAWGGLKGTIPFDALPQERQDRIQDIQWAEFYNQPQQQFDPSGQLIATHVPKGTPCN